MITVIVYDTGQLLFYNDNPSTAPEEYERVVRAVEDWVKGDRQSLHAFAGGPDVVDVQFRKWGVINEEE